MDIVKANADATLTYEQALAEQLIHYINAKPEHDNGLCWYLVRESRDNNLRLLDPYSAIQYGRMVLTGKYGVTSYIVQAEGPVSLRVSLARDILKLLEKGRLYVNDKGQWDVDEMFS